jgi:hypothetical protein
MKGNNFVGREKGSFLCLEVNDLIFEGAEECMIGPYCIIGSS